MSPEHIIGDPELIAKVRITSTPFVMVDKIINDKGIQSLINECRQEESGETLEQIIHLAHVFRTAYFDPQHASPYDIPLAICAVIIKVVDPAKYDLLSDTLFSKDPHFARTSEVHDVLLD
jgi:hypothetical protein